MRLTVVAAAAIAVLVVTTSASSVLDRGTGGTVRDGRWRVASESHDHITYVRTRTVSNPSDAQGQAAKDRDCNETTTTTAAPPTTAAPAPLRRRPVEVRSGVEGTLSGRRRSGSSARSSAAAGKASASSSSGSSAYSTDEGGDHIWKVSHRTDDHITYTRRTSSSQGQAQGQVGELRRIGTGSESVLARVVVPGKLEHETEEGLLEAHPEESLRGASRSRQGSRTSAGRTRAGAQFTGFPTNEIVHPYVKKSVPTPVTAEGTAQTRALKSGEGSRRRLKSGATRQGSHAAAASASASRRQWESSPSPPDVDLTHENEYPRVGDVLNGWVVISKSKDHISWQRWGTQSGAAQGQGRDDRLKALESNRLRHQHRRIPNPEGELVEGFPRVFNTYSRSFFVNERNVDGAGSIRTTLSDTSNWKVGDELAGWRVIGKDHRGIVWQRITNGQQVDINEEDLISELNRKKLDGAEEEESSESDSSSESESNEGEIENVYRGPPGTWYLAKETKNSITWRRDNTPDDIIFDMNAYPRIGDVQSGWKVKSKAREYITWVRLHNNGTEVDSDEDEDKKTA